MRKVTLAFSVLMLVLSMAPSQAVATKVLIRGFAYVPGTTVVTGALQISFTNQDVFPHTASYPVGCTPGNCAWRTPALYKNQSAAVSPGLPKGLYTYYCEVHPYMRGKLRVV